MLFSCETAQLLKQTVLQQGQLTAHRPRLQPVGKAGWHPYGSTEPLNWANEQLSVPLTKCPPLPTHTEDSAKTKTSPEEQKAANQQTLWPSHYLSISNTLLTKWGTPEGETDKNGKWSALSLCEGLLTPLGCHAQALMFLSSSLGNGR